MLESLVRPFQRPTVAGTRLIPVGRSTRQPDAVHAQWGASPQLPEKVTDLPNITLKSDQENWKEESRETRKIKIENPNNPDNWVEVERPEKMQFQKSKAAKSPPLQSTGYNPSQPVPATTDPVTSAQPGAVPIETSKVEIELQRGDPPSEPL